MVTIMKTNKRIYTKIIDILDKKPMSRKDIIEAYIGSLALPREIMLDKSTGGKG